jgi:hypothetical protein
MTDQSKIDFEHIEWQPKKVLAGNQGDLAIV